MLEKKKTEELIDSRLNNNYVEREAECMMHAAYLCISHHPEQRPRMSQVLSISFIPNFTIYFFDCLYLES